MIKSIILGGGTRPYVPWPKDETYDPERDPAIVAHYTKQLLEAVTPMHYRNGREAKNGDKVIQLTTDGAQITTVGVLYNATPGNDYCNGLIAPIQNPIAGACMIDCLHLDDVAALLKEKGLDKRPPGK